MALSDNAETRKYSLSKSDILEIAGNDIAADYA